MAAWVNVCLISTVLPSNVLNTDCAYFLCLHDRATAWRILCASAQNAQQRFPHANWPARSRRRERFTCATYLNGRRAYSVWIVL